MAAHRVPYVPLGWYVLRYVQQMIGHRFDAIAPRRSITRITLPGAPVARQRRHHRPCQRSRETLYALRRSDAVKLLILPGEHDASDELARHADKLIGFLDQAMRSGV